MIKAIGLDDEPPALQILSTFCSKTNFIDLQKTFTSTEEALTWLNKEHIDLLFLDINMPSVSGIDFYKMIPYKTMLIFTTAHAEFAIEGFNLHAIDYLLKPFTFERFQEAAEKAKEYYSFSISKEKNDKPEYLFLRIDYSIVKIAIKDILFIEGLDDYLKLHLKDKKPIVVRLTMKAILDKLPNDFIRVHRSYIVSFSHIHSVRNKIISIGEEVIPIGNSYEEEVLKLFNK